MCRSISLSDGQLLAAENVSAKTTASPVRIAAKSATVNCVPALAAAVSTGYRNATATSPNTATRTATRYRVRATESRHPVVADPSSSEIP